MAATAPLHAEMGPTAIEFGPYEIDTTCSSSPYPAEFSGVPKLYICEFCLEYTADPSDFNEHTASCHQREPCGKEIYSKAGLSVFEVDGGVQQRYCTNLCLHMKLFIDHKRKDFDVEDFHYYILTVNSVGKSNNTEKHIAGCFSKEKLPAVLNNNLSCVLILPQFQRQGYGRFLIDFSYALTRVEKKSGTPEKPLSRVGKATYQSYWQRCVGRFLYANMSLKSISVKSISECTGIDPYDIADTLQRMNFVKQRQGRLFIVIKEKVLKQQMAALELKRHVVVDEEYLKWTPPPPPPLVPQQPQQNNVLKTKNSDINDNNNSNDNIENNSVSYNRGIDNNHNDEDKDYDSKRSNNDNGKSICINDDEECNIDNEKRSIEEESTNDDNLSNNDNEKNNKDNGDTTSDNEINKSGENNNDSSLDDNDDNNSVSKDNNNNDNDDNNNSDDNSNHSSNNLRMSTRRNLRKQKTSNQVAAVDKGTDENNNKRKTRKNETGKRKNLRSMASDEDKDQQIPEPPPMKTRLRRGRAGSR